MYRILPCALFLGISDNAKCNVSRKEWQPNENNNIARLPTLTSRAAVVAPRAKISKFFNL